MTDPVVVIASEAEHPRAARVWGTGGWTAPEEREARDWSTLCRLLGWGVRVATPDLDRIAEGVRWVVIACAPDDVGEPLAAALRAHLERAPALVIARPATSGSPLARLAGCARRDHETGGRLLRWTGPGGGIEWPLERTIAGVELDGGGEQWLTLDGRVAALARRVGRGTIVTLGLHASAARDADESVTAVLRTLLIRGCPGVVAWLDMDGVLALRMDDAGGAQNVHLEPFSYRELGPAVWRDLAEVLRMRSARLGVAAVPGWVDDADPARGELVVRGRRAERSRGRVHPSWDVSYRDRNGLLHDYVGEFAALRQLARAGLIDVLLHGRTHMHPDLEAWARAPDRHTAVEWYREFGVDEDTRLASSRRRLADGLGMLGDFFGAPPSVLVFPGDAWTAAAIDHAIELPLLVVASYYVALRDGDRFSWAEQVCSPYLDEPDAHWFAAGVPVIGYFHARDVSTQGVQWVRELLDRWSGAGARRMIGLGELAFALGSRISWDEGPHEAKLVVATPPGAVGHRLNVRVEGESIAAGIGIRTEVNGRDGFLRTSASTAGSVLAEVTA